MHNRIWMYLFLHIKMMYGKLFYQRLLINILSWWGIMGSIHQDVYDKHLQFYPEEEAIIKPFINGFDVTIGYNKITCNTEVSAYFIKPSRKLEEAYGFDRELLVIYSKYEKFEPRTIQAAQAILSERQIKGRIDNLNYFLISEAKNIDDEIKKYISRNPESRIIVAFSADSPRKAKGDSYYIRTVMDQYLYGRDLFDNKLPLVNDYYFFGRKDIVAHIFNSLAKNENKGLFGLRKTGKTSVLYKIERQVKSNNGNIFYYDCKSPSIRKLRWNQLYEKICSEIAAKLLIEIQGQFDEINAADTFAKLVEKSMDYGSITLVFDEFEYISPINNEDPHWKKDFINFWQTFWSVQSRYRNICSIIVGVNPYPLEIDAIDGVQNPLFGIVSDEYLCGLDFEDTKLMIKTIGKIMGLKFEYNALEYVYQRYGGHPFLTRIACSLINVRIISEKDPKPASITYDRLKKYEESIDANLMFYCRHVVSELQRFYKEEYDLLELLASGQRKLFLEKSSYPGKTTHLIGYGLLSYDSPTMPKISIPIIQKYIGSEYMKRENRKSIYKIVDSDNREVWLTDMKKSIISDLRLLEDLIKKKNMPSLFGTNSFPEADEFYQLDVVKLKKDHGHFVNVCNRCFVESISIYGKSISNTNYFWEDIKNNYPYLWRALYRIKLYRHAIDHLELTEQARTDLQEIAREDLEGRRTNEVEEVYFLFQQCILDSLLTAIQIESNRLAS